MEIMMKSIYEKAVLAKEKRGEIEHIGKITSIRIDICVTQSFGKKTKMRNRGSLLSTKNCG